MKGGRLTVIGAFSTLLILAPQYARASTGLGSLEGLQYLFFAAAGSAGVAIFVLIPGLLRSIQRKDQNLPSTNWRKVLLGLAMVSSLLATPFALGYVYRPFWNLWAVGLFLTWLIPLVLLIRYFSGPTKVIGHALGVLFVIMVLRTPELISYTKYEVTDNQPLENPQAILEQSDSETFRLADGRQFRFIERYNNYGVGEKFPDGTLVEIRPFTDSGKTGIYALDSIGISQERYQSETVRVESLITIPLKTVTLTGNQVSNLGKVQLIEDQWVADDQQLFQAVNSFCCDPDWVAELIRRGADPAQISHATDWTLFHALAGKSPFGESANATARLLAEHGADINKTDNRHQTGFHSTFKQTMRDAFRDDQLVESQRSYLALLLELGADPNVADQRGSTPLHETIYSRFYSLSSMLLDNGADPLIKNGKAETALETAIYYRDHQQAVMTDEEHETLLRLVTRMEALAR